MFKKNKHKHSGKANRYIMNNTDTKNTDTQTNTQRRNGLNQQKKFDERYSKLLARHPIGAKILTLLDSYFESDSYRLQQVLANLSFLEFPALVLAINEILDAIEIEENRRKELQRFENAKKVNASTDEGLKTLTNNGFTARRGRDENGLVVGKPNDFCVIHNTPFHQYSSRSMSESKFYCPKCFDETNKK